MTMIKIGDRYINMDNVTSIVQIDAAIVEIESTGKSDIVYGEQAQALLNWLDCIAADVMKMHEQDIVEEEV